MAYPEVARVKEAVNVPLDLNIGRQLPHIRINAQRLPVESRSFAVFKEALQLAVLADASAVAVLGGRSVARYDHANIWVRGPD